MKRYLLFGFNHYYPEGGWKDFAGDFDTVDDALNASKEHFAPELRYTDEGRWDECHIICSKTGDYVCGETDEVGNPIGRTCESIS